MRKEALVWPRCEECSHHIQHAECLFSQGGELFRRDTDCPDRTFNGHNGHTHVARGLQCISIYAPLAFVYTCAASIGVASTAQVAPRVAFSVLMCYYIGVIVVVCRNNLTISQCMQVPQQWRLARATCHLRAQSVCRTRGRNCPTSAIRR